MEQGSKRFSQKMFWQKQEINQFRNTTMLKRIDEIGKLDKKTTRIFYLF